MIPLALAALAYGLSLLIGDAWKPRIHFEISISTLLIEKYEAPRVAYAKASCSVVFITSMKPNSRLCKKQEFTSYCLIQPSIHIGILGHLTSSAPTAGTLFLPEYPQFFHKHDHHHMDYRHWTSSCTLPHSPGAT